MATVKLGDRVRDIVSGFEGDVTARTEYAFGCVRVHVLPSPTSEEKSKNQKPSEEFFDEDRLEVIGRATWAKPDEPVEPTRGGGWERESDPGRAIERR